MESILEKIKNLTELQTIGYQLVIALQILSKLKLTSEDTWENPSDWDIEFWEELCALSYKERISICVLLAQLELKRDEK